MDFSSLTPALKASALIHTAALITCAVPGGWPWSAGVVLSNHAVLTAAGLWPRSSLLGSNWTCLPYKAANANTVAITIDDGPHPEVTPRVLDILDQYQARATFFCIGVRVLQHSVLAREIVRRGHSIENHSHQHHHNFSLLGPKGFTREIRTAQSAISDVTGSAPLFFRAPAGLRNPFLQPVLHSLGLQLSSWTRRGFDTRETDSLKVARRLLKNFKSRDIFLLHDGHCARAPSGQAVVCETLPIVLEAIKNKGLRTITLSAAL